MHITGKTAVFLTIAHPVGHLAAPEVFARFFEAQSLDAVMLGADVAPERLGAFVAALRHMRNLVGFCVTVPHKQAVLQHLDDLTPEAREAGAVNLVRRDADGRLTGHQLDGEGFLRGLLDAGHDPKGRSVLLAGAGGAATGIAFALARQGVSRLRICNRTLARAQELAARVRAVMPHADVEAGGSDPAGFDFLVNGTSAGLDPAAPPPFDLARADPRAIVAEIIMKPRETALLKAARRRGMSVHHGEAMLEGQVRLMTEYWGLSAPADGGRE